jgi:hypothetical protein
MLGQIYFTSLTIQNNQTVSRNQLTTTVMSSHSSAAASAYVYFVPHSDVLTAAYLKIHVCVSFAPFLLVNS